MKYTKFNHIFLCLVFSGLFLSALLALSRFGSADNDLILRHQIGKIDRLAIDREQLDFAVLGDSSAGNGISAHVLEKLSGRRVKNFALTGSFGLAGSLYLMQRLHQQHGVNQFVLVHSPDIWNRAMQKEAIFKLLPLGSLSEYAKLIDGSPHWEFFKYLLNPQRLIDTARYLYEEVIRSIKGREPYSWIDADFLVQREETFANGKRQLESSMEWKTLSPHKLNELHLVRRYCVENKLKCVLMSGPVHESAYVNLQGQMTLAFGELDLSNEYFLIDMSVHAFPDTWMGDTVDHVEVRRRPESTKVYWESMSRYLGN